MLPFVTIFGFRVGVYGLAAALAVVVIRLLIVRLARDAGLEPKSTVKLAVRCGIAAMIGAKLPLIVEGLLGSGRLSVMSLLRSGGVFYFGALGFLAGVYIYTRFTRLPLATVLDVLAPLFAIGHSIGRVGCFAAGCCFGIRTELPWGVMYSSPMAHRMAGVPLGVALHPTQLYESVAEAAIFVFLYRRIRRPHAAGSVMAFYLLLYPAARFLVEFVRQKSGTNPLGGPLTDAQWISLVLIAGALGWLLVRQKSHVPAARTIPAGTGRLIHGKQRLESGRQA